MFSLNKYGLLRSTNAEDVSIEVEASILLLLIWGLRAVCDGCFQGVGDNAD